MSHKAPPGRLSSWPAWIWPRWFPARRGTPGPNRMEPEGLRPGGKSAHVVAYDFGVKRNILPHARSTRLQADGRAGPDAGCRVLAMRPDGVFLQRSLAIRNLATTRLPPSASSSTRVPTFGICLGPPTAGAGLRRQDRQDEIWPPRRQPSGQDLDSGQVLITSQNHGLRWTPTSVDAARHHVAVRWVAARHCLRTDVPAFSFQGTPEAAPGPMTWPTFRPFPRSP